MNIKNEKGSTIILFALVITIIIGFVGLAVDFGYAVLKDLQLTNAIDAATLAAAQDLLEDDSEIPINTAREYLLKNGIEPDIVEMVDITFPDDYSIRLVSNATVDNRFMRVLGIDTSSIGAAATATIKPITKATGGIRPFGIEDLEYNYGQEVTLKTGDPKDVNYGSGNFGTLALGEDPNDGGASNLLDNALNGYSGSIQVGDWVDTEPGNMPQIVAQLKVMIDDDPTVFNEDDSDATYHTSGRVWVLPLITAFHEVEGRDELLVVGFAMFYVEDIVFQGGKTSLTGRFIRGVTSGSGDETAEDRGMYVITLDE